MESNETLKKDLMNFKKIVIAIASLSLLLTGCSSSEPSKTVKHEYQHPVYSKPHMYDGGLVATTSDPVTNGLRVIVYDKSKKPTFLDCGVSYFYHLFNCVSEDGKTYIEFNVQKINVGRRVVAKVNSGTLKRNGKTINLNCQNTAGEFHTLSCAPKDAFDLSKAKTSKIKE